jgi:hypothetical protein
MFLLNQSSGWFVKTIPIVTIKDGSFSQLKRIAVSLQR